jgi:hypothetical protein
LAQAAIASPVALVDDGRGLVAALEFLIKP